MAHENARILVVEDEDNLAMLIEYNLNKIGYVSEIADDGEKALDILKEKNFDLVVLDWMIPKISGIEVCRRIRGNSDFNKLPIILNFRNLFKIFLHSRNSRVTFFINSMTKSHNYIFFI